MSTEPEKSNRPTVKRADAVRNREQIITAARAAFADADADVSMAEISRRANVGMATLYRNFPNRRALLEALYAAEVDAVCQAAAQPDDLAPDTALEEWMSRFFAFLAGKKHLAAELLTHVDRNDPVFDDNRARVLATGRPIFDAARQAGHVRLDLTFEQALDMIVSIATIDGDIDYQQPILRTVLDGLAPRYTPTTT